MNKKLLFGIMSLAALTACTNDDFESKQVAQEASPIQFEVLNNDAATRASMNGNKIVWNANDGDIFTLYHGGAGITGFENAIYTAKANEGSTATLTTPTMIKQGLAVMVWPVDTTFRIGPADNLSIEIPADQKADIVNYIPYMSDQITIGVYGKYNEDPAKGPVTAWNTAGKDRKYPVFMRPMASQLIVKADYAGTDETIASLYDGGSEGLTGEDAIDEIEVTSVKLLTQAGGADEFTTNLDVKWTAPTPAINTQWASVAHNAWTAVTDFDLTAINVSSDYLETECLTGNASSKFLILPQPAIAGGVDDGAVVVNTIYGKVFIGDPTVYTVLPNKSYYTGAEYNKAWYRYLSSRKVAADAEENASATTKTTSEDPDANGKYKTVAKDLSLGMQQTINAFSTYTHQGTSVVKGEPEGAASTRYVEVRLNHLDMSDLHIKTDKQLRDAARVWKKMGLTPVTVYLDGEDLDGDGVSDFVITQKTIKVINTLNAGGLGFKVKPCRKAGEICDRIVITGSDYEQNVQDIAFIAANEDTYQADVVFANEGTATPWKWNGKVLVTDAGVEKIINEGTMENAATATLQTWEHGIGAPQNNVPFVNDGTWNINSGVLRVQFDVTNNSVIKIKKGAQYRQDGQDNILLKTTFTNERYDVPTRFGGDDTAVGTIWNYGTFATVGGGEIYNYGLIEHQDIDAKTYITANQTLAANGFTADANFGTAFNAATAGAGNKMGRINLPWNNKSEDNISINAALAQGFVSLTVDNDFTAETLSLATGTIGDKVNYLKVNSSSVKEIKDMNAQIKYLEVEAPNEVAWNVSTAFNFTGLMVLSDVNIKLGSNVSATVTYLGADMYVGGTFNKAGTNWAGYFGDTSGNVATQYITFK